MDIATLKAVIECLDAKIVRHREMAKWAIERNDDQAVNMWCNTAVECRDNMLMVQQMLDDELALRAEEAA